MKRTEEAVKTQLEITKALKEMRPKLVVIEKLLREVE
jgi:hypothetical protein